MLPPSAKNSRFQPVPTPQVEKPSCAQAFAILAHMSAPFDWVASMNIWLGAAVGALFPTVGNPCVYVCAGAMLQIAPRQGKE